MVELIAELIRDSVQSRFLVRTQNPVVLDDFSEPQPDIAVLRFRPDRYRAAHRAPTTSFCEQFESTNVPGLTLDVAMILG